MTDAEAQAAKARWEGGPASKKDKGKLAKTAKTNLTKPSEKLRAYDFERTSKAKGGIDVAADTKVGGIKAAPKSVVAASRAPIVDETPTQTFKQKASTKLAPKPQTIAQSIAEVKSNIPMKPLAGQGSMEGKPVAQVIDKRGAHIERKPGGTPPAGIAERRTPTTQVQAAKPAPKHMTPEGTVEAVKPVASPSGTTKMTAADLFGQPSATPKPSRTMQVGDIFPGAEPPKPSLASKAATKIKVGAKSLAKGAWGAVKTELKAADPTAPFRELRSTKGAARTSWDVAKAGVKGGYRLGKGLAKGAGEGILVDFAGQQGWNVGKAISSAYENESEMAKLRTSARKQGLKVSGGDTGFTAVGKGLVGAMTLGKVDLGRDIKVTEAHPKVAASLREKRLKQGEAKFQANKAKTAPKAEEFTETDYDKLKRTASRGVIKGSYRG